MIFRFLFALQIGFLVSFFSLSSNDIQKLGEIVKNPDLSKQVMSIQKTGMEYISNLGSELDKISPVIKKQLNCLLTKVTKNPISSQIPYASQVAIGIAGFFLTYVVTSIFCCLLRCSVCRSSKKRRKKKKQKKKKKKQPKKNIVQPEEVKEKKEVKEEVKEEPDEPGKKKKKKKKKKKGSQNAEKVVEVIKKKKKKKKSQLSGNAWALLEDSETASESEEEVEVPKVPAINTEGLSRGQKKRMRARLAKEALAKKETALKKAQRREEKKMRDWMTQDDGFQMVNTRQMRSKKKWEERKRMNRLMAKKLPPPPSDDGKKKKPSCRGTVYVESKKRGAVIGSGGSVLKALQELTGTRINMPERDSNSPIAVLGDDNDNVDQCIVAIKQLVEQGYCELLESQKPEDERRRQAIVNVPVDARKQFFGVKGCNIIALRQAYEIDIQCPDRDSDSECVVLTGNNMKLIQEAKAAIRKLCNHGFCEATHPGWTMQEVPVGPGDMGIVVGPRGRSINNIKGNLKHRVQIDLGSSTVIVKGVQADIDKAVKLIEGTIARARAVPKRGRGEEEPTDLAPFEMEDNLDDESQKYVRTFPS